MYISMCMIVGVHVCVCVRACVCVHGYVHVHIIWERKCSMHGVCVCVHNYECTCAYIHGLIFFVIRYASIILLYTHTHRYVCRYAEKDSAFLHM